MLEGVDVVEVVALLAELNRGSAVPELLHEKCVVPLHDLPNKFPRDGSHLKLKERKAHKVGKFAYQHRSKT